MIYENYHFWGMHTLWWFAWVILLVWIFATPYDIPFQRTKRNSPLYLLKKRLAAGQITKAEYIEMKRMLEG
ncbi:MAG TPA: SHOCT domain-containing protein [Catalimonadaceae bacterium]|nr:SHOCT domain-containing protein [Catalimonadaceae bacterium]HPI12147.1 SHOCT domain-containing protein [Catalimonadaceae bacterium]